MKKVMLVGICGYIDGKSTEYITKHYSDWQVDAVDSMTGSGQKLTSQAMILCTI